VDEQRLPARPPGARPPATERPRTGSPAEGSRSPLPGDVTWGWLQSLTGLLVAVAPVVLLLILPLLLDGGGQEVTAPTVTVAFVTLMVTVVLDSWYLFSAWLFSLRPSRAGLRAWGFRAPTRRIVWAVPVALLAVYGVSIAYNLIVETQEQEILSSFPRTATGTVLFVVLACVVAPFFEETFFRGFLFQGFARSWGIPVGALVSAAVFALSHQQFDIFVPLFALGLALAWVYWVTRSLWGSIALHAVYNGIAVLVWAFTG
jgi:hypothetical protein